MNIDSRIKKINMMSPGVDRDLKIIYLVQYLYFLLYSNEISLDEFKHIYKNINYDVNGKTISNSDLDNSILLLTCLYEEILNYANHYNTFFVDSPKINYNEMLKYVEEFLKYIDYSIYKEYKEMSNSNLVKMVKRLSCASGLTFKIGNGKNCILVENLRDFYTIITLVHEIGHVYYDHLSQKIPNNKAPFIETECLSVTFEYLFILFLKNNHLIDCNTLDMGERNVFIRNLSIMNNAYIYNMINDWEKLKYNDVREMFYSIDLDEYNKIGIIKPNQYIRKSCHNYIEFKDNFYAYGLLFAFVMRERFINDENATKKFIKIFPNYASTYEGNELIRLIKDDEYIKASKYNINRILSKTHYKAYKK